MNNDKRNWDIHIKTNNILILDFSKDWKVLRTPYIGEAKTIYSKEDADNMSLLSAEYTQNDNIILAGETDDNYTIKKLNINGKVSDSYKWEKGDGVESPIYRIDEGIYRINIFDGFQIWTENKGIAQNTREDFKKIFSWSSLDSLLWFRAKTRVNEVEEGKYFNVNISYGSTDTLHAMCSLETESKLKYYPYIASERTQDVIALGDEMLYLSELLMKFRNI